MEIVFEAMFYLLGKTVKSFDRITTKYVAD